ncbi:MAG: malate dehydrogenase [Proteobacteria bacterium]|nr:malate dehydrogenase [Pseudomonadota bacterium]
MKDKKIALIGAGNIGGTMALLMGLQDMGEIVLLDVAEGIPQGKSLDIEESLCLTGSNAVIKGSNTYEDIKNADLVIVTAGIPRKPGMSRDDLLNINAKIIEEIGFKLKTYTPNAFVIVVTNPLDAMVWVMQKATGFSPQKVVGMAGVLDGARMRTFLAQELNVSSEDITTLVLGGHGDTMVLLSRFTSVGGIPLPDLIKMGWITQKRIDEIIERTRNGGGEIVNLLKTGSAFYAPALSVLNIVKAYLNNTKKILPCAAWCQGEYGLKDIYVGVPVIIGKNGVERIIEIPLTETETALLHTSAETVKKLIEDVKKLRA